MNRHWETSFSRFRSTIQRITITLEELETNGPWKVFQAGPQHIAPVVFLPGLSTTVEAFHKQALFLVARGYRVVLVQWSVIWSTEEWLEAFGRLLDDLKVEQCHLVGSSLGGFLAQVFACKKPHRALSLVLINTFCTTRHFEKNKPIMGFAYAPDFYLKKLVLQNFNQQAMDDAKVEAIDWVVEHFEELGRREVASRLEIMCTDYELSPSCLPGDHVTIINSWDTVHGVDACQNELFAMHPEARRADIKCGGDFPFLAYADDVNLHLQVHLRRVGCNPVDNTATPPGVYSGTSPAFDPDEDLPEPVDLVFDDEEESTVPVDPVAGFEAAQAQC